MSSSAALSPPLRARLAYEPVPLQFGTSGRRGLVLHLTQLEIYINALAELEYLLSLPQDAGGILAGDDFFLAHDLRPSSTTYSPTQSGRGELAQAVEQAVRDAGLRPVNLGPIPTPALTFHALSQGKGSMMITGSHIPFDRNGYKTNTSRGELLKIHEEPITAKVGEVRARIYNQPFRQSLFQEQGLFKSGHRELTPAAPSARETYLRRYLDFFGGRALQGERLLVYQHSAVGRDLLVELLARLGAEVIPAGRSESFVPIDTENIDEEQLAVIRALHGEAAARHGAFDAVVSTDGDSDRPLILGVDPATSRLAFFAGDLVGMITAEFLAADAAVVPITCNDAIDRGVLKSILEPKTKIGSPHVIAGMELALARGKRAVCGWEANGGFLTASPISRNGKTLAPLPTRDAFLPILSVLCAAREKDLTLTELFARLPARFSRAALLKNFPRERGLEIVRRLSPPNPRVREEISRVFTPALGFGEIDRLDYTDGVRILFASGEVAHLRPSGNADEMRFYAVADSQQRADAMTHAGVAEPGGILRLLSNFRS